MGLLNIIRKLRLRLGLPIREIARRTGLSRNTVKKYLKEGTIEPVFATPERSSKLDPFAEKLAGWLKIEAGKSRKQRRTLKQLHADLVKLGFTGSCNRVAAFARMSRARKRSGGSFSRRIGGRTGSASSKLPGAGHSFRCPSARAKLSSLTGAMIMPFWAASAPSCRSPISSCRTAGRFCCARICFRPTRCCSMRTGMGSGSSAACLVAASTTSSHCPPLVRGQWRGRTAVDRVGRGKERQVNMRFLAMTNHYAYEPDFCNPAAGWDRAIVRHWSEDNGEGASREERPGLPRPDVARHAGLSRLNRAGFAGGSNF